MKYLLKIKISAPAAENALYLCHYYDTMEQAKADYNELRNAVHKIDSDADIEPTITVENW